MFTLRKVKPDGTQHNFYLGKSYSVSRSKDSTMVFGEDDVAIPVFSGDETYIMVNGRTVDNVTLLLGNPGTITTAEQ